MKLNFLYQKVLDRSFSVLSEFINICRHYSIKLAFLTLYWWLLHYLHLSKIKQLVDKRKQNEIDNIIKVKCKDIILKYNSKPDSTDYIDNSDYKVWCYWAQGSDKMPPIVQKCIEQMKLLYGSKLIILDLDNIKDYIEIPDSIYQKLHSNKLMHAHFSDILRNSLIAKYGGLWLDSTCWTTQVIPDEYMRLKFFSVNDSHTKTKWVSYAMGSGVRGNITSSFVRDALIRFANYTWPDYLLQDRLIAFAYNNFSSSKQSIESIPENNSQRMVLFANMNKPFDRFLYRQILSKSWIFKLSYKAYYSSEESTFYQALMHNKLLS